MNSRGIKLGNQPEYTGYFLGIVGMNSGGIKLGNQPEYTGYFLGIVGMKNWTILEEMRDI